jgi:hypothetical protein
MSWDALFHKTAQAAEAKAVLKTDLLEMGCMVTASIVSNLRSTNSR